METSPQPWETEDGWEQRIARPVIRHRMAPREAVSILEAAGHVLDQGIRANTIVTAIWALERDMSKFDGRCYECRRPLTPEDSRYICMECVDLLYRAEHESFEGQMLELRLASRRLFEEIEDAFRGIVRRRR